MGNIHRCIQARGILYKIWPSLVVALVLGLRNPAALFRAEFWAEDGIEYFANAIQRGWSSLFEPLGGYLNFIPRLLAVLASHYPVVFAPYIYALFSLCMSSAVLAFFASDRFEWLIQGRRVRIILCVLFTLASGADEVVFAICNHHTLFTLFYALYLLQDRVELNLLTVPLLGILALSTPELPVLIPLGLLRYGMTRNRSFLLSLAPVVIVGGINFTLISSLQGDYAINSLEFLSTPRIMLERFFIFSFLLPFLGPSETKGLMVHGTWFWIISLIVLLLVYRFRSAYDRPVVALTLWLLGALYFGVMSMTRPYLNRELQLASGNLIWDTRYAFFPVCVSLVTWGMIFSCCFRAGQPFARWISYVGFSIVALQVFLHPTVIVPRPTLRWPYHAARIQEALGISRSDRVTISDIPVHPHGQLTFSVTIPFRPNSS